MENDEYEIAFISDFGLLGDYSVTQASWEGVRGYSKDNGIASAHYIPDNQSVGAYLEAVGKAAGRGAKLVVASGVMQEIPVWHAQNLYPDVRFILVDALPHNDDYSDETIGDNVAAIRFNTAEAGFLAGYAAVKAGLTSLGFIGAMPVPDIAYTGTGFILGAESAANELGYPDGSIEMRYAYFGTFLADSKAQVLASEWFGAAGSDMDAASEGVELIYAAGGELEHRVAVAAAAAGKRVILYENAGSWRLSSISAVIFKDYANAVRKCLSMHYSGKFPGGEVVVFGASDGGVGLVFPEEENRLIGDYVYRAAMMTVSAASVDSDFMRSPFVKPYTPPRPEAIVTRAVRIAAEYPK
jgi:basic membrane protein A